MKKLMLLIAATLISVAAFAQEFGEPTMLRPIYGTSTINVIVDFSKAEIIGFPYEERQEAIDDWARDRQEIYEDFVENLNDRLEGRRDRLVAGDYPSAEYTIVVTPKTVTLNGYVTATIQYMKNLGEFGELFYSYDAKGKGGKLGTFTNLVGDGFDSIAKVIAKDLKQYAGR